MITRVTDVLITFDGDGADATITVKRTRPTRYLAESPSIIDVPVDIRSALQAWLDDA